MKLSVQKTLEEIRKKRQLRVDAREKEMLTGVSGRGKMKVQGRAASRLDDDEIWRTTEAGNKIMLNGEGEVIGGNAYAVGAAKAGGAKVASGAISKAPTPKKEPAAMASMAGGTESTGQSGAGGSRAATPHIDKLSPEIQAAHEQAKELSNQYYQKAKELAEKYPALKTFTDHHALHIDQVCEKSLSAADTLDECLKDNPEYGPIDRSELLIAARLHDTGMDGDDAKEYPFDQGNALRGDHSINSAMHVLENRAALEAMGVDVDKVALDVFAHSKSASGMRDLNDEAHWAQAFAKMDNFVTMYNERHPDNPISFDKSKWTDGTQIGTTKDKDGNEIPVYKLTEHDNVAATRSTIAALRFGDANRDAPEGNDNITQGGGVISVDSSGYNHSKDYGSWQNEVKDINSSISYEDGSKITCGQGGYDKDKFSVHVYAGEGNISTMNCVKGKNGEICEEFTIKDATFAPHCTFAAIEERLGEMATATGIPRSAVIKCPGKYTPEQKLQLRGIYQRNMDKERAKGKYTNISLEIQFDD